MVHGGDIRSVFPGMRAALRFLMRGESAVIVDGFVALALHREPRDAILGAQGQNRVAHDILHELRVGVRRLGYELLILPFEQGIDRAAALPFEQGDELLDPEEFAGAAADAGADKGALVMSAVVGDLLAAGTEGQYRHFGGEDIVVAPAIQATESLHQIVEVTRTPRNRRGCRQKVTKAKGDVGEGAFSRALSSVRMSRSSRPEIGFWLQVRSVSIKRLMCVPRYSFGSSTESVTFPSTCW